MSHSLVEPIVDLSVRGLCQRPYGQSKKTRRYSHPNGCPNYQKKQGCPPDCRIIEQIIDLSKPIFAIWNEFDFAGHCQRMRQKHPRWSRRQIECCLYWQPKARKQLGTEIIKFLEEQKSPFVIVANPEGAGVNVTATMKQIGIELEWPPQNKTYQVALAGKGANQ